MQTYLTKNIVCYLSCSAMIVVINCSALAPPLNAAVSPSSCLSRSTYGQTCRFYCPKAGYVLQGTSARVCGNDGEWSGANDTLCKGNLVKHPLGLAKSFFICTF